jgi:hypothetical protein
VARLVLGLLLLLLALGAATYVAGEQTEVAALRTRDATGGMHETELWVVDHAGAPWVRVANPERAWFARLREQPQARAALDAAFRAKYGLVDWWYGLLLRRGAVPVALAAPRSE